MLETLMLSMLAREVDNMLQEKRRKFGLYRVMAASPALSTSSTSNTLAIKVVNGRSHTAKALAADAPLGDTHPKRSNLTPCRKRMEDER